MGLAEYMIVAQDEEWGVLHDGSIRIDTQRRKLRLKQRWPQLPWPSGKGMKSASACRSICRKPNHAGRKGIVLNTPWGIRTRRGELWPMQIPQGFASSGRGEAP